MDSETEMQEEIKKYLVFNSCERLADCLDMVPIGNQYQIYNMIVEERSRNVPKTQVAFHVSEDVGAIVGGHPEKAIFSKEQLPF